MAKPSFLAIIKNRVVVNWNKKKFDEIFYFFFSREIYIQVNAGVRFAPRSLKWVDFRSALREFSPSTSVYPSSTKKNLFDSLLNWWSNCARPNTLSLPSNL